MATITSAGAVPANPTDLLNAEIAAAQALSPGLTANLPGSLVEDMASTAAGALVIQDQAYVDLVNSISPYTANEFVLYQLGAVYGVQQGVGSNTSVYVTFSGSAGFVIPVGFTVSDGTHQYTIQDGGIISAGGQSTALYCLATVAGSWSVPAGTVTQIISSLPSGYSLTCTNLSAGLPGATAQAVSDYRAQVIQAGLATAQGAPQFLKTLLLDVNGVQPNLVSVRNISTTQWEIICGGGDPYQIANAIFEGIPDISMLVGSTLSVTNITQANPGVVTTNLNHGYTTGQVVTIAGVIPTAYNANYTITVLSNKTFSIGVNTTGYAAYTSGGVVTPNLRNVTVSVNNYPDTYNITFVNPPVQTVVVSFTWNTTYSNYVSPAAVAQLAQPAIATYINSIAVGQPINGFELQAVFQNAVAPIIPPVYISRMVLGITIAGVSTSPVSGTALYYGDPESYFSTSAALISVNQG